MNTPSAVSLGASAAIDFSAPAFGAFAARVEEPGLSEAEGTCFSAPGAIYEIGRETNKMRKHLLAPISLFVLTALCTAGAQVASADHSPAPSSTTKKVRIVLAGDSTVTDEIGWGLGFKARLTDGAECVNLARNGRSSKSYRAEGLWEQVLAQHPDYVLIQFGHNDMPGKGPERETTPDVYGANLARYVDEARTAGAVPILVTSLSRRYFGPDGAIHSDLVTYVEVAKHVASEKKVALIDLHQRSIEQLNRIGVAASDRLGIPKADGSPDRTHLSAEGSRVFGGLVADEFRRILPEMSAYVRSE